MTWTFRGARLVGPLRAATCVRIGEHGAACYQDWAFRQNWTWTIAVHMTQDYEDEYWAEAGD